MDRVDELVSIMKGIVQAGEEKKKVEDRLLATTGFKSIKVSYDIDESLIGGMQIRIGDRVVDSSISTKIAKLKQSLMNTMLD